MADDFKQQSVNKISIMLYNIKQMEKLFWLVIIISLSVFASCSKNISPVDSKLQGKWHLIKNPQAVVWAGSNIKSMIFNSNNFLLEEENSANIPNQSSQNRHIEGKYKSDSMYINFYGEDKGGNKISNENGVYKRKLRYKFSGDTLILGMFNNLEQTKENDAILPYYFLKEINK